MVIPSTKKHHRLCEATVKHIEQDACGHADQQVAVGQHLIWSSPTTQNFVVLSSGKRVLRSRENVLTHAWIASSRVRLWSNTSGAGVRGQHRVQGNSFLTRRRLNPTLPCAASLGTDRGSRENSQGLGYGEPSGPRHQAFGGANNAGLPTTFSLTTRSQSAIAPHAPDCGLLRMT